MNSSPDHAAEALKDSSVLGHTTNSAAVLRIRHQPDVAVTALDIEAVLKPGPFHREDARLVEPAGSLEVAEGMKGHVFETRTADYPAPASLELAHGAPITRTQQERSSRRFCLDEVRRT